MKTNDTPSIEFQTGITIRRIGAADMDAVRRLADLDSADVPQDEMLGAEVEGRLLAVISLASGKVVADPFSRTSELRALLQIRAAQMRKRTPRRLRFRSRASLAGSPPGAGGRLLSLPLRPY